MMTNTTPEQAARSILDRLKSQMLDVLWNDSQYVYNNAHMLLPWIQEEAEYAIEALNLPVDRESWYFEKIKQILGEFSEEP